ncbi:MAG: DUF1566 domain-containing protein [Candidatus Nitrohelix vancouverensis]|uniref:DUF1566 domain-containing protein n=1 Tax=Candidatus Nitrohelix vancouverensis TaxID=2705534 RepID=A0A7T0C1Z4_9BACT|nr:MAG: DUF1566 domain-containing protein [Candidatus Nitrohelix vancouverensis]
MPEVIFEVNEDGTVTDSENDVIWSLRDSRQLLGKWLNWDEANSFVEACNEQSYLGFTDWRLPTKSELRVFFKYKDQYSQYFLNIMPEKKKRSVSNYQSGGETSVWTSETRYDSYAWKCYFPSGKEICVDQSVSTTGTSARLVRDA